VPAPFMATKKFIKNNINFSHLTKPFRISGAAFLLGATILSARFIYLLK
jgi:hypothetical protein